MEYSVVYYSEAVQEQILELPELPIKELADEVRRDMGILVDGADEPVIVVERAGAI